MGTNNTTALIDLTGRRFGRLRVIKRAENTRVGQANWQCTCDCGIGCVISGKNLRAGLTRSCGCLHSEWVRYANLRRSGYDTRDNHDPDIL